MFQIIFNELSAAEISSLPKKLQLELLAEFQILPEDLDHLDSERFGVIQRKGKKLYRYRAKDYRIYFAKTDEGVTVHRVLHKNTFRDFLFRSKLPVSEDAQLRGHARDATGENLAALGDKFFQEIRVLVVDRFDGDVDPAARHGTISAAEGGTAFGGFGLHGELLRFAMKRVPF